MYSNKRNIFSILYISLLLILFTGFNSYVNAKAISHKEPVTDPDFHVNIYNKEKAYNATTLFFDIHKPQSPRIIEVDMQGRIVWEYKVPWTLKQYLHPGPDVEWLPNNNILAMFPRKGAYEINRKGDIVWSYKDDRVSHDADRLPNGNTLMVFGANDTKRYAQVKEVDSNGKIVWEWYAREYFDISPYKDISWQGWAHTNSTTRLSNGNTLVSLRNFNLVVEVDPKGAVVKKIGEGIFYSPHDPEFLPGGNILVANQNIPPDGLKGYPNASEIRMKQPRWHQALELDPNTGKIVWQSVRFRRDDFPVRDADRLPNGNTLITTSSRLVEVTKESEIVWELKVKVQKAQPGQRPMHGFYKAERVAPR